MKCDGCCRTLSSHGKQRADAHITTWRGFQNSVESEKQKEWNLLGNTICVNNHTHETTLCIRTSALSKTYIKHIMGVDIMEEMKEIMENKEEIAEDDNAKY